MILHQLKEIIHMSWSCIQYETKYRVFNFLSRSYPSFPCGHLSILYRTDFPYYEENISYILYRRDLIILYRLYRTCLSILYRADFPYYTKQICSHMNICNNASGAVCAQHQRGWPKIQNCWHQFIGKMNEMPRKRHILKSKMWDKIWIKIAQSVHFLLINQSLVPPREGLIYQYHELCNKAPILDKTKYDPTTRLIRFWRKYSSFP